MEKRENERKRVANSITKGTGGGRRQRALVDGEEMEAKDKGDKWKVHYKE